MKHTKKINNKRKYENGKRNILQNGKWATR